MIDLKERIRITDEAIHDPDTFVHFTGKSSLDLLLRNQLAIMRALEQIAATLNKERNI